MPPKYKFKKDEIVNAALGITRERGIGAVTAREVAAVLGASSKVIFGLFENMGELTREVITAAGGVYEKYLKEDMAEGKYPPYKASGMAYIRFAKEEPELFRLLFMRDRTNETVKADGSIEDIIKIIMDANGIERKKAELLHLEMWIFTHGIATMIAISYLTFDVDLISRMMTDAYMSIKERIIFSEV